MNCQTFPPNPYKSEKSYRLVKYMFCVTVCAGAGLGSREHGISQAIRVKIKHDTAGVCDFISSFFSSSYCLSLMSLFFSFLLGNHSFKSFEFKITSVSLSFFFPILFSSSSSLVLPPFPFIPCQCHGC